MGSRSDCLEYERFRREPGKHAEGMVMTAQWGYGKQGFFSREEIVYFFIIGAVK